jgi:transposase
MRIIHSHAAGIDIGSKEVFVAIKDQPVKVFDTFTEDLEALADYLLLYQVVTVAMEATGVYWMVLYSILDSRGLDVWLVDGKETKQVPGRKTDVKDSSWILQLHSYGLLKRCFVPQEYIQELRSYQRLREDHIRSSSMHINHMQKALIGMNIRLPEVISQVHGASGMKMIHAILDGQRDPETLLSLCNATIRNKKGDQVLKALRGHYSKSGLFALRQAVDAYAFYKQQIEACDRQIQELLQKVKLTTDDDQSDQDDTIIPPRKPIRHNAPKIKDLGRHLLRIFGGKDANALPGITDYTWLQLLSEVGDDLSKWKTEKHFTSWLGLAPGHNQSGKRNRRTKAKGKPKAGQLFRLIAQSLIQSKGIALGAFGRRIRARKGPRVAIKAVARKLAELYWRFMVKGADYVEKGVAAYEEKLLLQKQKTLTRLAKELDVKVSYSQ